MIFLNMDEVIFKERKGFKKKAEPRDFSSFAKVLIGLGFTVLSFFLLYNGARSLQIANEKKSILAKAEQEVTNLRLKNIALLLDENKIETDDYTEIDIRNRLNYSKNGEIVFVISSEAYDLAKTEVDRILATNPSEVEFKDTWVVWKDLFLNGI